MLELWGLFFSGFLASTLLPGGSEVALLYAANQPDANLWLIGLVTSLGNTLGGMSSWGLGWWIKSKFGSLDEAKQQRALERVQAYGSPVLLLSWLPVIGDPLCLAAGWLRVGWLPALIFIGLGKAARYAVLLYLV